MVGILIVVEEFSCLLNPFQIWFGFVLQMGRAWLSELANNLVIGAAWAPSRKPELRPRRWHAEVIRPAQHRWLRFRLMLILPESCFTSMHFNNELNGLACLIVRCLWL